MIQRVLGRQAAWNFSVSIPVLEASIAMDTRYRVSDDAFRFHIITYSVNIAQFYVGGKPFVRL